MSSASLSAAKAESATRPAGCANRFEPATSSAADAQCRCERAAGIVHPAGFDLEEIFLRAGNRRERIGLVAESAVIEFVSSLSTLIAATLRHGTLGPNNNDTKMFRNRLTYDSFV